MHVKSLRSTPSYRPLSNLTTSSALPFTQSWKVSHLSLQPILTTTHHLLSPIDDRPDVIPIIMPVTVRIAVVSLEGDVA